MYSGRVYYKLVSPYLMVAVLLISIGMLLQTLSITLSPYFITAGILILLPAYTIRFFRKYVKSLMDVLKLVLVWYWSLHMALLYEHMTHWSLMVVQVLLFIIVGRHEMKAYAKSISGFSPASRSSFILFTLAGVIAAAGSILQFFDFTWAVYWVAFGLFLGIIWIVKGWLRL